MAVFDTSELRRLSIDLQSESPRVGAAVAEAVRNSAERVAADGRRTVPVKTGALRASIGFDLYDSGRKQRLTAVVGPSIRYGLMVEYGTVSMAPRPYMGPAFTLEAPKLEKAIEVIAGTVLQ